MWLPPPLLPMLLHNVGNNFVANLVPTYHFGVFHDPVSRDGAGNFYFFAKLRPKPFVVTPSYAVWYGLGGSDNLKGGSIQLHEVKMSLF